MIRSFNALSKEKKEKTLDFIAESITGKSGKLTKNHVETVLVGVNPKINVSEKGTFIDKSDEKKADSIFDILWEML